MVRTDKNLTLPDGLELNPLTPDFLNKVWPVPMLDSSLGSLMLFITIIAIAFIVFGVLALIGRGMSGPKGAIFTGFFTIAALFAGFVGFQGVQHWRAEDSIKEYALGQAADKANNWLYANGISATRAQSVDLVCDYYEAKSRFCTGRQAVGKVTPSDERQIKLSKGNNDFMVLTDIKNQLPLIGEGAS